MVKRQMTWIFGAPLKYTISDPCHRERPHIHFLRLERVRQSYKTHVRPCSDGHHEQDSHYSRAYLCLDSDAKDTSHERVCREPTSLAAD